MRTKDHNFQLYKLLLAILLIMASIGLGYTFIAGTFRGTTNSDEETLDISKGVIVQTEVILSSRTSNVLVPPGQVNNSIGPAAEYVDIEFSVRWIEDGNTNLADGTLGYLLVIPEPIRLLNQREDLATVMNELSADATNPLDFPWVSNNHEAQRVLGTTYFEYNVFNGSRRNIDEESIPLQLNYFDEFLTGVSGADYSGFYLPISLGTNQVRNDIMYYSLVRFTLRFKFKELSEGVFGPINLDDHLLIVGGELAINLNLSIHFEQPTVS